MTRTTKTAAAAPSPRNGRNGEVRTVTVSPEALQDADLGSAATLLPAHLREALQTAQQAQQVRQDRAETRKIVRRRVTVTAAESAALEAIGWEAPFRTANYTAKPQKRDRFNTCKGAAVYNAAVAVLSSGQSLKVTELAMLWIASGGDKKPFNAIVQQISNRAQRVIEQQGNTLIAV